MRSVYLSEPLKIAIRDIPEPVCQEGEVKVKIEAASICGSDVTAYKGESPLCTYPRIIGHELIGTVVEVKTDKPEVKVGDQVVIEPYIYCGKCYPCSIGRTNCCEKINVIGVHIDGGMREYFCHRAKLVFKVPEKFPLEELVMAEPLSIAVHSIHRLDLKRNEHVVIIGAGPIGNLAAQVAMVLGATPILVDLLDSRLSLAKSFGIKHIINPFREDAVQKVSEITGGRMAECLMEATGAVPAIRSTLDLVAHAGRISLVGWPKKEVVWPTNFITKKELDIRGSRNSTSEIPTAIQLITERKVNVRPLISKIVSLEELPDNVKQLAEKPEDYLKIVGIFK